MTRILEPERYDKAIKLWGKELQFGMLSEECGELLTAINQWRRGRVDKSKVVEEMADVMIMIRQIMVTMKLKVDDKMLDEWITLKLKKMELQLKLSEERHNQNI